ncbi:transcription elongation factor GreA [Patescibacteria group bacterium]|mgnify:CR=1 FL=1|nr:transcription elongation factor GreA [Patescibacteria group bacterium]
MEREFITKAKKDELEAELEELKTTKRAEILERLAFAKSLGDLSENAEYHTSKEAQGKNEARISQIEAILKNAELVEANDDGSISLGSTVVVVKDESKETITYQIVGNEEADFSAGKISFESPLGSSLMDKTVGDQVIVETPKGSTRYTVKEVR